jgi:hypothetical protein
MKSHITSETAIYMQDGEKLYLFSHVSTATATAFGTKDVYTLTVFHSPMPEALATVKQELDGPNANTLIVGARDIVQKINSHFNNLTHGLFTKS